MDASQGSLDRLTLAEHGAERRRAALTDGDLTALRVMSGDVKSVAGRRIFAEPTVGALCRSSGSIGALAAGILPGARAVRAVMFDKTPANNWAVAWHQDRTIAVRERIETLGFGPWSVKGGLAHVEPPFDILAGMITLRIHLDDCGPDNAPLLVALGSHRLGKVRAAGAAPQAEAADVATCIAGAGDVWVYATPILHASRAAATPGRRRVLQVDFAAIDLPAGLAWAGV